MEYKSLGEQFYDELWEVINRYSGMEMTNAEAVGYFEIIKNEIIENSKAEYDEEDEE